MGSAGVGYVMVTAVLSILAERKLPPLRYRVLQLMLWMLLGLVELLVCMSIVSQPSSQTRSSVELFQSAVDLERRSEEEHQRDCVPALLHRGFLCASESRGCGSAVDIGKGPEMVPQSRLGPFGHHPLRQPAEEHGHSFWSGTWPPLVRLQRNSRQETQQRLFQDRMYWCVAGVAAASGQVTSYFYSLSFCKSAVALVLPTALIPGVIYWMFIKKQS
uniref:Uncharacterized protein n=1 Tax=Cyprinus carpio carpio TaxID=630221 RepID=A0A9J8ASW4_CYPCA